MRWFQLSPAVVTWRSRATLPSWFDLFRLDKIMILVIPIKTFFIITKITKMKIFIWHKITPIMLCPDFLKIMQFLTSQRDKLICQLFFFQRLQTYFSFPVSFRSTLQAIYNKNFVTKNHGDVFSSKRDNEYLDVGC